MSVPGEIICIYSYYNEYKCTHSETVLLGRMVTLVFLAHSTREETILTQVIVETLQAPVPAEHTHSVTKDEDYLAVTMTLVPGAT